MLGRNAALLERAGTLVPRAGRSGGASGPPFAGHHNIGMELLEHPGFVRGDGTLDELSRELAASPCDRAVISAESLSFVHHRAGGLARLREAIVRAGFEPIVVIYFRGQATYARSIYAMSVVSYKSKRFFRDYCAQIFTYRAILLRRQVAPFEYDRLLRPFENIFGKQNIVVRAYGAVHDAERLLADFLAVVHPAPLVRSEISVSEHLNVGGSLWAVMSALHANRAAIQPGLIGPGHIASELGLAQATLDRPFDPLDDELAQRFYDEFRASNERLRDAYGVTVENDPPARPRGADEQLAYLAACEAAWRDAGPA
jgi:hypothetical protein